MRRIKILSALVAGTLLMIGPAQAQAACVSGGQINQAVSSGKVVPFNEALSRAGENGAKKFVTELQLCDQGGQAFYRVSVLDQNGYQRDLRLPANR